jgi:hypothetical protein
LDPFPAFAVLHLIKGKSWIAPNFNSAIITKSHKLNTEFLSILVFTPPLDKGRWRVFETEGSDLKNNFCETRITPYGCEKVIPFGDEKVTNPRQLANVISTFVSYK